MVVIHWRNTGRGWQIFAPAISAFTPPLVLSVEILTASNPRRVGRNYTAICLRYPNGGRLVHGSVQMERQHFSKVWSMEFVGALKAHQW
ncbi:MAG: hypothetical protein OXE78_07525 [Gammaproteobacteria bacterium]|nr:hypothetical protein [Gammaproteobacteria bacterium]